MTAGQVSDYTGAAALSDDLLKAQWLPGDAATTPIGSGTLSRQRASSRASRAGDPARPVGNDERRYLHRSRIKIMFGRLRDWRRVATLYDRRPTVFFSAVALAATVIFWLRST